MVSLTPVITIQCDWNDVIRLPRGEAWITSKIINQQGIHDKLTTTESEGRIRIHFSNNDYQYVSHSPLCLVVKHVPSDLKVAFIAASKAHKIHAKGILSVAVAENALAVSSCEEHKLLIWDTRTEELILTLQGHGGPVYKCRYFPSGIVVISAGADGSCRVWSAESGINPVTLKGHSMAITDVCIIDKGRNVISVSKDGAAKLWDVGESNCLANVISELGQINCCALVTSATVEIEVNNEREVGTSDKLVCCGCESGLVVGVLIANRTIIFSTQLDAACNVMTVIEQTIIVGCSSGRVVQINTENGSVMKEWHESASPVLSAVTLSNQLFIIGRQDGTCTVISLQDAFNKLRVQLTGSDCDGIRDISFNGKWVFTGCRDSVIRKYDFNQINVHFK